MSVGCFEELVEHIGHKIEVISYDKNGERINVAIECETCGEVLLDFDKEKGEQKEAGGKMEGLAEQVLDDEYNIDTSGYVLRELIAINKLLAQVIKEKKGEK